MPQNIYYNPILPSGGKLKIKTISFYCQNHMTVFLMQSFIRTKACIPFIRTNAFNVSENKNSSYFLSEDTRCLYNLKTCNLCKRLR